MARCARAPGGFFALLFCSQAAAWTVGGARGWRHKGRSEGAELAAFPLPGGGHKGLLMHGINHQPAFSAHEPPSFCVVLYFFVGANGQQLEPTAHLQMICSGPLYKHIFKGNKFY